MISRLAAATVALVLTVGVATGCSSPAAAPELSPTFTSKDQAFAAAEATYRAYVDALNKVDLSDPSTFEGVYAWTTGEANAGARESFSQMHADGWTVDGPTMIALLQSRHASPTSSDLETIGLDVCLDVSGVTLVDSSGNTVVSNDRRDIQSMFITVSSSDESPTGFVISHIDGREGAPDCAE